MSLTVRTRFIRPTQKPAPVTQLNRQRRVTTWRDSRFWLGLLLIAGSLIAGNSYVAHVSARSLAVVVTHPIAQGTVLNSSDLSVVQVALPQSVTVVTSIENAVGHSVSHDIAAGELVTQSALESPLMVDTRIVAIPIRAGHMPSVAHGSRVDVWVTPSTQGIAIPGPSELVVAGALVDAVPDQFDPTIDTSLSLAISSSEVAALMQGLRDGLVDVVAVPSGDRS